MRDTRYEIGSALILAVVLTSLLAIVGVMFVMVARVDKIATSAIAENRELNFAVDTVIAKISQELVLDTPGIAGQEYYDYPDPCSDPWLATLEPYDDGGVYRWRQISDIYNRLAAGALDSQAVVIPDYQYDVNEGVLADADGDGVADSKWVELRDNITSGKGKPIYAAIRIIDNGGMLNVNTAYKFDPNDVRETIDGSRLAQIHMLDFVKGISDDVNNLHRFRCGGAEPDLLTFNDECAIRIENPDRTNINYLPYDISDELELRNRFVLDAQYHTARIESAVPITLTYPAGTTFRNRFAPIDTSGDFDDWKKILNPFDPNNSYNFRHLATTYNMDRIIAANGSKMFNINTAALVDKYIVRDKIKEALADLDPSFYDVNGIAAQITANLIDFSDIDSTVTEVNDVDGNPYYGFERPCVYISELAQNFYQPDPNDPNRVFRSYALELHKPYFEDTEPFDWRLIIYPPYQDIPIVWSGTSRFHVMWSNDPNAMLSVDFSDFDPNAPFPPDGETKVDPNAILSWPPAVGANSYDVYFGTDVSAVEDANTTVPLGVYPGRQPELFFDPFGPMMPMGPDVNYYWRIDDVDSNDIVFATGDVWKFTVGIARPQDVNLFFGAGSVIELCRPVSDGNFIITVDSVRIPLTWVPITDGNTYSFQRDITPHKSIRRLWGSGVGSTLGGRNIFVLLDDNFYIQAHPANEQFTNIGEIGMLFRSPAYYNSIIPPIWPPPAGTIGYPVSNVPTFPTKIEAGVRLNLADPNFQQIFKYLTVFDPSIDGIDNDGDGYGKGIEVDYDELKIPGRININTAPWYVIAQLPWVENPELAPADRMKLAQAIVAYRDKLDLTPQGGPDYSGLGQPGFGSIGALNNVVFGNAEYGIDYYRRAAGDQPRFPDLSFNRRTLGDGAPDDFEERDLIFARISNLVTVRSDVFTAYILVRIGADGPQKRVVAILDRSDVYSGNGKVKVVALHPVPDPR